MKQTTRSTATWMSGHPCYVADGDERNPYRLTLYVADNGAIMLAADGNGCASDIPLEDIDGWSDADINEKWRLIDTNVLAHDVQELHDAGFTNEADFVWDWLCHADSARCVGDCTHTPAENIVVELAHLGDEATEADLDRMTEALHRNGYTWARSATDGEAGTTDGITDAEWQRVMAEAFNRGNGGCDHGNH